MDDNKTPYSFDFDPNKSERDYLHDLSQLHRDYANRFKDLQPPFHDIELEYQIEKNETAMINLFGYQDVQAVNDGVRNYRINERLARNEPDLLHDRDEIDMDDR